jgi:hypothetical protein
MYVTLKIRGVGCSIGHRPRNDASEISARGLRLGGRDYLPRNG